MTIRSDRSSYRMLFDAADPVSVAEKRHRLDRRPAGAVPAEQPVRHRRRPRRWPRRLAGAATATSRARIDRLYRLLYGRPPTQREVEIGLAALTRWSGGAAATTPAAWEQYCQVLLCANEFMYVD